MALEAASGLMIWKRLISLATISLTLTAAHIRLLPL
jgi:hypothetical protein